MKPSTKKPTAADYPALRRFLRGYFHQDLKDEYGSPEEAAQEFWNDADEGERTAVAREWARLLTDMKDSPLNEFNRVLTRELGSAYSLTAETIQQISLTFSSAKRPG